MSLHVYTSKKYVPAYMDIVREVEAFYEVHGVFTDDAFTEELLRDVQHAKYHSSMAFMSLDGYPLPLPIYDLCGGVKAALCVKHFTEMCFTNSSMDDVVFSKVLGLKEGHVLMTHAGMSYADEACDIVVNGSKYVNNIDDFWGYVDGLGKDR